MRNPRGSNALEFIGPIMACVVIMLPDHFSKKTEQFAPFESPGRVNLVPHILVGKHKVFVNDRLVSSTKQCKQCGAPIVAFDLLSPSPDICLRCTRLAAAERMSFRVG